MFGISYKPTGKVVLLLWSIITTLRSRNDLTSNFQVFECIFLIWGGGGRGAWQDGTIVGVLTPLCPTSSLLDLVDLVLEVMLWSGYWFCETSASILRPPTQDFLDAMTNLGLSQVK